MGRKLIRWILIVFALINLSVLIAGLVVKFSGKSDADEESLAAIKTEGKRLFDKYACASCHGPDGATPAIPSYPKITGQDVDYTRRQLIDIRDGARANGYSGLMSNQIEGMTDEEADLIAKYVALSL